MVWGPVTDGAGRLSWMFEAIYPGMSASAVLLATIRMFLAIRNAFPVFYWAVFHVWIKDESLLYDALSLDQTPV